MKLTKSQLLDNYIFLCDKERQKICKEIIEWHNSHYWDSLDSQKDIITLHLNSLIKEINHEN